MLTAGLAQPLPAPGPDPAPQAAAPWPVWGAAGFLGTAGGQAWTDQCLQVRTLAGGCSQGL